ncbi:MAG: DUF1326 domain-containing protein, partial [Candidatus Binatia bacterium]
TPTKGHCHFALVFEIDKGTHGNVALDGLSFAVLGYTPAAMGAGDWSVGVVVDERANDAQRDALVAIASGKAGGPMAALAPLLSKFLGVETKPIRYQRDGMRRSVSIDGVLDQALEGVASLSKPGEPVVIDNGAHPANARLALAKATRSHLHAFGMSWDDTSGRNNGHFAPFSWQG